MVGVVDLTLSSDDDEAPLPSLAERLQAHYGAALPNRRPLSPLEKNQRAPAIEAPPGCGSSHLPEPGAGALPPRLLGGKRASALAGMAWELPPSPPHRPAGAACEPHQRRQQQQREPWCQQRQLAPARPAQAAAAGDEYGERQPGASQPSDAVRTGGGGRGRGRGGAPKQQQQAGAGPLQQQPERGESEAPKRRRRTKEEAAAHRAVQKLAQEASVGV